MIIKTRRAFEEEINRRMSEERMREELWRKQLEYDQRISELEFRVRCLEQKPEVLCNAAD